MTTKHYKRIILHAGLHKTGTTSIQDNCYHHRDCLLRHGIKYPVFQIGEMTYTGHSHPLTGAIRSKSVLRGAAYRLRGLDSAESAARKFSEQLQRVLTAPEADTLLLSAEQVCDFNHRDMKALRDHLEQYTRQLDVIAYIRSPLPSLVSIVQQRCRDGIPSDPAAFHKVVKERYLQLKRVFAERLRVVNFHEAAEHPSGIVGYFLCDVGVPEAEVATLTFERSNESISKEAFTLMKAINDAYPRDKANGHSVERRHNDLRSLNSLPGQRFALDEELDPDITRSLEEQRLWLERELQTTFPPDPTPESGPLWQERSLLALESAINRLYCPEMRAVACEALRREAARMTNERPETAAILEFIAKRIDVSGDPPTELLLEQLGADYFKFSALQIQQVSIEMALSLMQLAKKLRADAPFIEERIRDYQARLKNTE